MDTIFALATAPGKAGVAVIRISGPDAFAVGSALAGTVPAPKEARLRRLSDGQGAHLDDALILTFQAPHSFTGEDVVEFQVHGSPATVKAVLAAISATGLARMAEPGEFTRRALENDRMDLAQVEGLADLIDAETEAQRVQALRVLSGSLGQLVEGWRENLLRAAALLEVTIDFADEEVPVDVTPEVVSLLSPVMEDLSREIAGVDVAERIRDGFEVAILGAPNAGKSTLLNALAGREAAITSDIAGTTRDVIEVRMDLRGLPVTVLDTAGLRDAEDEIERIGIDRARSRAEAADLRVFLKSSPDEQPNIALLPDDIVLLGKADLYGAEGISGTTGQGVSALIDRITETLSNRAARQVTATHARHAEAMRAALGALEAGMDEVKAGPDRTELAAEHLRSAIRRLDSLIGRIDVEMVLGEIFSRFCLGK
ncbi:tRNA uridine-5-carboxymethylaminomethyl(34) synthesis GTPase MnmE [Nioella ostreopsis]|uniref:tRNA uridine-5-carboxymethylaminomethyl(34) synthesis GTPase MnmE n=1 Tax=Nioella ostreopsis TaxID=2448479 RepID=UPI000FDB5EBD|nr:tRNA uridine-5-carboxymethylaminomethyl(34) synthesis GTPase MnmE [Nioella ostreopsis]